MAPLYVTQFKMNGHPCVLIYRSAESLQLISPLHLPRSDVGENFLGTIEHQFLSEAVAKACDDYGHSTQERPDFDREHAAHLVPR